MTNKQVRYEVVRDIINELLDKIKITKSRQYVKLSNKHTYYYERELSGLFALYVDGDCIQNGIELQESAILILHLYSRNKILDMMKVVSVDYDFSKNRNDAIIYEYSANNATSPEARLVAMDRMGVALDRMRGAYQFFEEKSISRKLDKIDK